MARKRNEARSFLPAESGAAPAPERRSRHPRAQTTGQTAEPGTTESVVDAPVTPAFGQQTDTIYDPASEHDEIARLAYSLWEARGGLGGSPEDDWLRAEQEYRLRQLK